MPFVQRAVEPKFLSRTSLRDRDGQARVQDEELQAITNCTLSGALRQLASLVLLAEDVFAELTSQLNDVVDRSKAVQSRIGQVGEAVERYDPKKVTVPEGSLSDFATRKVHYTAKHPLWKELFTPDSRPRCVRDLYSRATTDRLSASILEQLRKDSQHSPYLLCTPVLGSKRRRIYQKIDADIETHIPAAVEDLRKWTSKEAIGDVTALPDASMRIASGVTLTPEELSECGSGDDEPIDHKLPSPEEQLRIIISKFAPEVVPINTTGKFFDRMCSSRKSLLHIETNGETDTVKRRTRSRKPRGKRRNTISGTDQKELREAIAGDTSTAVAPQETSETSPVVRSHSSDLLKKSPIDPTLKKSHFNSLKQWGKTRLKMISRSPSSSRDSFRDSLRVEKKETKSPHQEIENLVEETITMRKKRCSNDSEKKGHQRCASYSSSEKSIALASAVPTTATISAGVKLRGSSAQRRLRRAGIGKDEPHSSSGNWSASSESGRTSIGSEITTTTVPPKSTTSAATSNNSLNFHHGPPSSIISRRRFLNTSGSGSVTSEGTLTPDIIHDLHEDMETSSEYSCDTEGYYTSFHMDSGLKTLKEEDISPSTPLHTSNALSNSSNSQNMTAENEYELFGKGSTSTTTSSAGTVCTTLLAAGSDRSLVIGPAVPERKSSLTKLNRSKTSIHSANSSLDRGLSSPLGPFSTLGYQTKPQRALYNNSSPDINQVSSSKITITNNVGMPKEMTAVAEVHTENDDCAKKSTGTSSPDSGHNTSSSPIEDSISSAQGKNSLSEQDYSESSDLEGTDRIERIRYKTTINSSRIPSLCVITPSNSDDESVTSYKFNEYSKKPSETNVKTDVNKVQTRPKMELPLPSSTDTTLKENTSYCTNSAKTKPTVVGVIPKNQIQSNSKNSLHSFNNLMCKLKGVLPHKLSTKKSPVSKDAELNDSIYDSGDYVTIADFRNNNQKANLNVRNVYGNNEIVKKNLQTVLSGQLQEEYVSLNELPNCLSESKDFLDQSTESVISPALEEAQKKGAKVTLDSHGKVVYSSDSIRRRKGAHTTFEPGPFVQDKPCSPIIQRDMVDNPAASISQEHVILPTSKPTSPQLGKIIIKASNKQNGPITTEIITLPTPRPNTIITAAPISNSLNTLPSQIISSSEKSNEVLVKPVIGGAFVNINDAEGVSLSPTKFDQADYRHLNADASHRTPKRTTEKSHEHTFGVLQQKSASLHIPQIVKTNNPHTQAFRKNDAAYWTLPKRISEIEPQIALKQEISRSPQANRVQAPVRQYPQVLSLEQTEDSESLKISPIDPRASGSTFQSSTPSGKEVSVNLTTKLLSPVRSTMTNEELYAVIHKSKKKLNIKDQPERADSPALSATSLSPVSSESSLVTKGLGRYPESGYLIDSRTRSSWVYPDQPQTNPHPFASQRYPTAKTDTTCADRHGPIPQTSRLDFKKLLLQHGVKLNTLNPQQKSNKISAVELLKISKDKQNSPQPVSNVSQVNILDLSGSPKTYANRKVFKAPSSPVRANQLIKEHKATPKIMLSPKAQWRFSSPRSDVLSSTIPEANNEDDTSNSSGEKQESPRKESPKTVPINTNQHFGARRNLIPINENALEADNEFHDDPGVSPLADQTNNLKLQGTSRAAMIQAKRAEFFKSQPQVSPPKFTSFKGPTATAFARSGSRSPEDRKGSPTTLETDL